MFGTAIFKQIALAITAANCVRRFELCEDGVLKFSSRNSSIQHTGASITCKGKISSIKKESFRVLADIESLAITRCTDLEPFFEVLPNLEKLERLHVFDSDLKSLPDWMGGLSNLKEICFSCNSLESTPISMRNMKNLEAVVFRGNELREIPEWIRYLKNLRKLYLVDNQITKLPDWIDELKGRVYIDLDHNPIQSIPDWIRFTSKSGEFCDDMKAITKTLCELSHERDQLSRIKNTILVCEGIREFCSNKYNIRFTPEDIKALRAAIQGYIDSGMSDSECADAMMGYAADLFNRKMSGDCTGTNPTVR